MIEAAEPRPSDHDLDLSRLTARIEANRSAGGSVFSSTELQDLVEAASNGVQEGQTVPAELFIGAVLLALQGAFRSGNTVVPLHTDAAAMLVSLASGTEVLEIPRQPNGEQLIA